MLKINLWSHVVDQSRTLSIFQACVQEKALSHQLTNLVFVKHERNVSAVVADWSCQINVFRPDIVGILMSEPLRFAANKNIQSESLEIVVNVHTNDSFSMKR